ncbi:MAG: hypothetical protein HOH43_18625 [Candidatus Latescibacteria bacterium]|nr:hypothetical protein [Candidatus Latescibacterota bacterium]
MPFIFSEEHISDYYHHGYTVFRGILPPSLIGDLRRVTDVAREIAYELHGPSAQRLQPIGRFADRLDLGPFRSYEELPALNDALHRVLTPNHTIAGITRMGVFFEPAERPWCTRWHRDITANSKGVDADEYALISRDATFFTQVNCVLYTDVSTWYVPGSDGRPDLPEEPIKAEAYPETSDLDNEAVEHVNLAYCMSMPGGIQFILEPGDFALYRPNAWHIGNYAPYRKRATIHDGVWKPEVRAWYDRRSELLKNEE